LRGIKAIPKELNVVLAPQNQSEITVVWIPGHQNIKGNEQADRLAKEALTNREVETVFTPGRREAFEYIERIINEEWQNMWKNEQTGSFFRKINPTISNKLSYTNGNRKKEIVITRLRLGKNQLNSYMKQINLHENGLCGDCNQPETTEHYLIECPASEMRKKLEAVCIAEGISCDIENVLNNKKTIDTIYQNTRRRI
jgi:hypothetical protein